MIDRVAIYLPSLDGGGAERAMVELANGLSAEGVSVDLVVVRDNGPWASLVSDDVTMIALRTRSKLLEFLKFLRYLHHAQPDTVLAGGASSIVSASLARRVFPRIPVIARISGDLSTGLDELSLKGRLVRKLQDGALMLTDVIVANSLGSSAAIRRKLPRISNRIHTLHNPVVWPNLADESRKPVAHPWFRDDRLPIVLSAGRLEPVKDHANLLRAFALVLQDRDARLVVLGEGRQRPNLVRLAHELGIAHRVDFPGFRMNPFAFMAKSQLFVLSSLHEGMPNVLIQAMACGTPVVSTDCPSGPREVLEDGKWGPLVPVGDSLSLATAIMETLERPPDPAALIQRASAFSAEASIRAYLNLMRRTQASRHTHQ